MQFPGTMYICTSRVLCQALEPTAFLVHPVLAVIADAVAAHSSATDDAIQNCTRILCTADNHRKYQTLSAAVVNDAKN